VSDVIFIDPDSSYIGCTIILTDGNGVETVAKLMPTPALTPTRCEVFRIAAGLQRFVDVPSITAATLPRPSKAIIRAGRPWGTSWLEWFKLTGELPGIWGRS
jgi:hypothetical protein